MWLWKAVACRVRRWSMLDCSCSAHLAWLEGYKRSDKPCYEPVLT